MKRLGAIVLGIALLTPGWWFFGPRQLGGPVSYVVIRDDSMEPILSEGDLVLVRERAEYRVGDAVAYFSSDLREVVLAWIREPRNAAALVAGGTFLAVIGWAGVRRRGAAQVHAGRSACSARTGS